MKNCQKNFLLAIAALSLGGLLTLSFAPFAIFPFACIAPLGLLKLWQKVTPQRAFRLGLLFGLGFYGTGVYWVYISIHFFGEVSPPVSLLITSLLIVYLALFPALTGYFLNRYFPFDTTKKYVLAFPALWVASEWVRSWMLTGFPWLLLGYSQNNSPLKGFAPILSVYGVSLAVVMTSGFLFAAFNHYRQKKYQSIYFSLFAIVFLWSTGGLLNLIRWTKPQGEPLTVSLVQGNIPQQLKWSPEHLQLSLDRYAELTRPLWGKSQLIVWPEAAVPLPLDEAQDYINALDKKAKVTHTTLLAGIPIKADNNNYYNAIAALGSKPQLYIKRHLVPFGEYTPLAKFLSPFLGFMHLPMSDLIPGQMNHDILTINHVPMLTSICYEIAFPELIYSQDKTVGLLLTVTNDAWFGKSTAQAQHLQMASMRAIEMRRPVLMVSNDGITAIMDTDGNVNSSLPPYQTRVLQSSVQPVYGLTPWMRNGVDPLLFLLLVFILIAIREKKHTMLAAAQNNQCLASENE